MPTMTKITKITSTFRVFFKICDQLETKITEMMLLEKTISKVESPDQNTFIRYWADQESAQEWIDFITETLAAINEEYISAEILDNPDL